MLHKKQMMAIKKFLLFATIKKEFGAIWKIFKMEF